MPRSTIGGKGLVLLLVWSCGRLASAAVSAATTDVEAASDAVSGPARLARASLLQEVRQQRLREALDERDHETMEDDDGYAAVARAAMQAPLPPGSAPQVSDQLLRRVVASRVREARTQHRIMKDFMRNFARNLKLSVLEDSRGDMPEARRLAEIARLKAEAAEDPNANADPADAERAAAAAAAAAVARQAPPRRHRHGRHHGARMLNAPQRPAETQGPDERFLAPPRMDRSGAQEAAWPPEPRRRGHQASLAWRRQREAATWQDASPPQLEALQRREGDGVWVDDREPPRQAMREPRLIFADSPEDTPHRSRANTRSVAVAVSAQLILALAGLAAV